MPFTPVRLIGPHGHEYTALDAIELNDLMARGYQRVEVVESTTAFTPSPVPRENYSTVGAYVAAVDESHDSE